MIDTPKPEDVQATFCLTLVDEWVRGGIRHAVVCPGSRSTPLALALEKNPDIEVRVHLDERSAGFVGLGIALATGVPAVVCVTSGTAVAELHPSVVEAHHQGVPLIVCTADRPSELRNIGAPQTIDQNMIYAASTKYYLDVPPAEWRLRGLWRSLAARAYSEALYGPYGPVPVHLNLQFREPLVGRYLDMPPGRPNGRMWHLVMGRYGYGGRSDGERVVGTTGGSAAGSAGPDITNSAVNSAVGSGSAAGFADDTDMYSGVNGTFAGSTTVSGSRASGFTGYDIIHDFVSKARGIIVVGQLTGGTLDERASITRLAKMLGWPLLADPLSMCRTDNPEVIAGADAMLQDAGMRSLLHPDVVIRFGKPWASKTLNSWLAELEDDGVDQLLVDPYWQWSDPARVSSFVAACTPESFVDSVRKSLSTPIPSDDSLTWLRLWQSADIVVQDGIDRWCEENNEITGIGLARELSSYCTEYCNGSVALVVSSSMPIRDAERFVPKLKIPPRVFSNRGANGIDGVVSTAMGIAEGGKWSHVIAWVGDLAFFHDLTALLRTAGQSTLTSRLTIVVMDNGGGGIFSFLPQSELVDAGTMERLFTTRQEQDVAEVAKSLGAYVVTVDTMDLLRTVLKMAILEGIPAGMESHIPSMEGNTSSLELDNPTSVSDSLAVSSGHHTDLSPITVIHAKVPSTAESARIQIELQQQISKRLFEDVIDVSHH